MNKLTRALVLGLATSAFALAGCATTSSSAKACTDCADPGCEKCAVAKDCTDCGGPANCEKCASNAATLGASNGNCPFSGNPVDTSTRTVSFQGQEVGFCCNDCADKFEAMTDADKMAALGK